MKRLTLLFTSVVITLSLSSQQSFYANVEESEGFSIDIIISPSQTLYGISLSSGATVADLMALNQKNTNILSLDEVIRVPLSREKISSTHRDFSEGVPIYYRVQTGDNLYRIAKRLGQTPGELMTLNTKTTASLALDETLLLGWIKWPYKTSKGQQETRSSITSSKQTSEIVPLQNIYVTEVISLSRRNIVTAPEMVKNDNQEELSLVRQKGIAFWEKSNYQNKELIVMHPHAKVNSQISLYNPMLKRKVKAKVVSDLPKEVYPDDISVVISPSVASALGALDRRFQVEITYVE